MDFPSKPTLLAVIYSTVLCLVRQGEQSANLLPLYHSVKEKLHVIYI